MGSDKFSFVQTAITDTQATIRAIDVKVGALLVLVLAPFANISRVFGHIDNVCCSRTPKLLFVTLAVLFFTSWLLALISLVRAIAAIDNPAAHINSSGTLTGSFYGGGLYKLDLRDIFYNRAKVKARKDLPTFSIDVPDDPTKIENEMVFEHMKVVYIREMKLLRLKWGIRFAVIWLLVGMIIFFISHYSIGCAKPKASNSNQAMLLL